MAGEIGKRERDVIDFERDWHLHEGGKESAIKRHFGFSAARYYDVLARAIASDAALAYDPLTVRRLRRRRDLAKARTAARDLGHRLGR